MHPSSFIFHFPRFNRDVNTGNYVSALKTNSTPHGVINDDPSSLPVGKMKGNGGVPENGGTQGPSEGPAAAQPQAVTAQGNVARAPGSSEEAGNRLHA